MMKKTTIRVSGIAAALFGLFAAGAHADVIISGDMRAGVQFINDAAAKDYTGVANAGSQTRVDGRTNLYFKGSEDLGNGLKAIWQVQTRFGTDGTGNDDQSFGKNGVGSGTGGTFANQDTFVGLAGNFGMLRLGNDTGNMGDGKYDKTFVEGLDNNGGFFGGGGAGSNMIRYDLPSFGKLNASYQWWTGENKANGLSASNGNSVRVDYGSSDDPWSVGAGYSKLSNVHNATNTAITGDVSQATMTAGVNFDAFTLAAEYQVNTNDPVVGNSTKVKNLGLYGYYTAGNLQLGLQWGQSKDDSTDTKTKETVLMAHYSLSKRTTAYAEYLSKKPDNKDTENLMVVGLSTSF
jgi:predicted porin